MTFDEFKALMQRFDQLTVGENTADPLAAVAMFDCGLQQHGENLFSYQFDGFMTVMVRFNEDGSINEWPDCNPEIAMFTDWAARYPSVEAYEGWLIEQLKI